MLSAESRQPPQPPVKPSVDQFLQKNSVRGIAGRISCFFFSALLIGLVIHSFPSFRMIAVVVAAVVCIVLAGIIAFPAIKENLDYQRHHGYQRIQSNRRKQSAALDGSIIFTTSVPVLVFLGIVVLGILIGAM